MESYFTPDGGGYHHHRSHFNNKKGTAACRIQEPPGVTKAEQAEAGSISAANAERHCPTSSSVSPPGSVQEGSETRLMTGLARAVPSSFHLYTSCVVLILKMQQKAEHLDH